MSDYMKEAERLMRQYTTAVLEQNYEAIALYHSALLAHIQRGAVPEGWQVVPKEPTPEMLAGGWGYWLNVMEPGKQRDTAAKEYAAMLAAAPAPDHSALSADRLWPVDGLYPDMLPPATSKERWMFDQGRLAERRIAMDAMRGEMK